MTIQFHGIETCICCPIRNIYLIFVRSVNISLRWCERDGYKYLCTHTDIDCNGVYHSTRFTYMLTFWTAIARIRIKLLQFRFLSISLSFAPSFFLFKQNQMEINNEQLTIFVSSNCKSTQCLLWINHGIFCVPKIIGSLDA